MASKTLREIVLGLLILATLLMVPALTQSSAYLDFGIRLAALGIFATSLNLLIGFGGMVSFGHALYFGLGAYSFGLILKQFNLPVGGAMLCAILICAATAACLGAICVRLKETSFSFITLAFQMLFHSLIISFSSVTGGDQGIMGGLPRPPIFGFDLVDVRVMYCFACIVAVLSLLAMRYIIQSPFGYTLRMVRDNADRARFLGINVWKVKLYAFVIAGCFAGVGGIVMALFVSGAFPEFTYWTMSGEAVFMVLMGGLSTFIGPVVGAAVLLVLNDVITRVTEHHGLVLGPIVLLFALGFKRGIADFFGAGVARLSRRRRPHQGTAPATAAEGK